MERSPANVFATRRKSVAKTRFLAYGAKALEEIRFRPMYASANID
jgi:hypothetical protein